MGFGKTHMDKKKRIIIGVLAVSVVTIILGLGLGLGLQLQSCRNKAPVSCRNRCFEPYDRETQGCHCDAQCIASNNCCYDFQDICLQPTESWECTALRCGEKRISGSKCHCSADCLSAGDCCTNYNMICNGVKSWVEDECVNMTTPKCPANFKRQPLLLISLDGLRAEYQQTWHSLIPVLDKLRTCGTSTAFMQPVFPTVTFPNHYSIVTGLYTESHGLVHNSMYDPVFDASFSLSNEEKTEPRWYLGQPIWHTAMYQGLRAGTFFWPGSDVEINGSFPNIYEKFDGTIPYELRILTVLKWLQLPDDQRPDFMTLYMEEPDKSGHNYGPVSGGVISALQKVDIALGQLMNGLKQLNLHECINIIVLADHGMVETSCDRREVLQDIVGDISNLYVYEGALGRIRARDKTMTLDAAGLVANMTCKKPDQQIKAYLKHHLPQRFHYINSRRIEDVSVLVNPRWLFERYPGSLKYCTGGTHGYDNDEPSMQAMFLSYGPKFHSQTEIEPFSSIELYNLMCDVLEITPAENNGTHGSLNHILQSPPYSPQYPLEQSSPGQCPLTSLEPTDPLGCSCPALGGTNPNSRLNLTDAEIATSERKHLPFGRPRVLQSQSNYCLLHHEGFASGYSRDIYMPLWSSFTIEKPAGDNAGSLPAVTEDCLRPDVRVPADQSATCDQYNNANNITHAFLYPPSLNSTAEQHYDGLILSNVVPVYPEFKKIWQYFQEVLLLKYSSQYNGINVVTGPAFYYNHNGAADQIQFVAGTRIPIPTHYFAVLTTCLDSNQPVSVCVGELYTMCFILPHRPDNSESCMSNQAESTWVEDLVWFHQARISDVELLTGLNFFQDSGRPIPEVLRVKTRPTAAIHRKT
ncbi:ectonucleotide pyrophosphatase/phosphodiesterase family member 3 [Pygocentrus nattereri]|uniref:SMB domain-containing protein n=1 Tax=Pygocentrus nattereri TaxID=42514 RepID=A0A3B4CAB2_PYGNA|nr:ectonucleotide pyrophosphatase/phosphodiesterase family member 3 [Pygocentrus nattereri]